VQAYTIVNTQLCVSATLVQTSHARETCLLLSYLIYCFVQLRWQLGVMKQCVVMIPCTRVAYDCGFKIKLSFAGVDLTDDCEQLCFGPACKSTPCHDINSFKSPSACHITPFVACKTAQTAALNSHLCSKRDHNLGKSDQSQRAS
jgi:hypothetical protein